MAKLVVLQITGAPKSITGKLQRVLFEIAPGTFVGKLPVWYTRIIWANILETTCSAICIVPNRSEAGFAVATHGKRNRNPVDNFGVALMQYQMKNKQEFA